MEGDGGFMMLYEACMQATSQDPLILKAAEEKLTSWADQPGFFSSLAKFITNFSLDTNVRFMASLYLKNGIEKSWRKICLGNTAYDNEKLELKRTLEHLILAEPQINITTQLAVAIGKIARFEVPRDWPTLLPLLLESLQNADSVLQYKALLVTYRVVKVLSTKRLVGDRKTFQDFSAQIFDYLHNLWDSLFITWVQSGASGDSLDRAHYALKVLRILSVRGYKKPHESQSIINFMPKIMARAKEALQLRLSRQETSVLLEKHVIVMWKIVGDMLETHPLSFVPFLHSGLEFATFFGFSEEGRHLVFERIAIHALNLLKSIILCPEFRAPKEEVIEEPTRRYHRDSSTEASPLTYEAEKIRTDFFTEDTLKVLVRVLVTRYFPLTQSELDSWTEDPEEFALRSEDAGESWKYNLRQSAETLFVTLFKDFHKSVETLLQIMIEYQAPVTDTGDVSRILAKDALYNAAGIVSYQLYDDFCFETMLKTTLIQELSLPVPILHRRIIWFIGQWAGVKISSEARPTIFTLLLTGLRSPDVVVKLNAAQALRKCVDDFDFVPEQFAGFIDETFHSLFALLQELNESDNKMRVLNVMNFLIEVMGKYVKNTSTINALTQYLPILWNSDHNMLKAAVVATSNHLVQSLGRESACLHEFLFPVIRVSTDLKTPEHVYLLEDGLDLWLSMMEFATDPPGDVFLGMIGNLIPLLGISTEHLKITLNLVNSYCFTYGELFAEHYGNIVCTELNSTISDIRAEGVVLVLRAVENLLRSAPNHGPNGLKGIIAKIFRSSLDGNDPPFVLSIYMSIVARLLLLNESMFQLGLRSGAPSGQSEIDMLSGLVDSMMSRMSHFAQLERRKLISLALIKLMSMVQIQNVILHKICGIFLAVGETIHDLAKVDAQGGFKDSLFMSDLEVDDEEEEGESGLVNATPFELRKRGVMRNDVVYSVDLLPVFRNEVQNLKGRLGESGFNELMTTVDSETLILVKPFL